MTVTLLQKLIRGIKEDSPVQGNKMIAEMPMRDYPFHSDWHYYRTSAEWMILGIYHYCKKRGIKEDCPVQGNKMIAEMPKMHYPFHFYWHYYRSSAEWMMLGIYQYGSVTF